ncbi:hypothetical protein llap_15728 [Limosa lapponica baueri]|uniref:Uncharacterized protein n=1 Tax=Limosa lapponica baueri TaxID=1758121 RepID=A0A2I0TJH0_LIMLA|nr:hypothetical protein llap_15728 [Limosa lapponica baueri]
MDVGLQIKLSTLLPIPVEKSRRFHYTPLRYRLDIPADDTATTDRCILYVRVFQPAWLTHQPFHISPQIILSLHRHRLSCKHEVSRIRRQAVFLQPSVILCLPFPQKNVRRTEKGGEEVAKGVCEDAGSESGYAEDLQVVCGLGGIPCVTGV